jgi:hypothetical protein
MQTKMLINGQLVHGEANQIESVLDPATGI